MSNDNSQNVKLIKKIYSNVTFSTFNFQLLTFNFQLLTFNFQLLTFNFQLLTKAGKLN